MTSRAPNRDLRLAACLLIGGSLLALATPAYLAHVTPSLRGYLLHPTLFLLQLAPWLLCAALWLPWRSAGTARVTLILSTLMFAGAMVLYVPMLATAGTGGGDMIGLTFVAISGGTIAFVIAASAIALLIVRRWRR